MAKIEVGDIVTVKGEVSHVLEEGRILIIEFRSAMAPVRLGTDEVVSVVSHKKWRAPRDKPD